jgi:hypothetical protein
MASEATLTIKIDNKKPVEITDFADSFQAIGNEYYKFLLENSDYKLSKTTKLYVREINTGSITTILTDLVVPILPFIEYTNSIIEYSKFLKVGFDFFLGKGDKPKEFDITDCNNFNNIIKPIAKDNGSQVIFTGDVSTVINSPIINFNFDSIEANAIQNGIANQKKLLKQPSLLIHEKVLFYWDSAKYTEQSKSADKGFIDSLNLSSLKVIFDNQETKKTMLDSESNPFHLAYLVDVEVMTVQNIPIAYKITALHEYFAK